MDADPLLKANGGCSGHGLLRSILDDTLEFPWGEDDANRQGDSLAEKSRNSSEAFQEAIWDSSRHLQRWYSACSIDCPSRHASSTVAHMAIPLAEHGWFVSDPVVDTESQTLSYLCLFSQRVSWCHQENASIQGTYGDTLVWENFWSCARWYDHACFLYIRTGWSATSSNDGSGTDTTEGTLPNSARGGTTSCDNFCRPELQPIEVDDEDMQPPPAEQSSQPLTTPPLHVPLPDSPTQDSLLITPPYSPDQPPSPHRLQQVTQFRRNHIYTQMCMSCGQPPPPSPPPAVPAHKPVQLMLQPTWQLPPRWSPVQTGPLPRSGGTHNQCCLRAVSGVSSDTVSVPRHRHLWLQPKSLCHEIECFSTTSFCKKICFWYKEFSVLLAKNGDLSWKWVELNYKICGFITIDPHFCRSKHFWTKVCSKRQLDLKKWLWLQQLWLGPLLF